METIKKIILQISKCSMVQYLIGRGLIWKLRSWLNLKLNRQAPNPFSVAPQGTPSKAKQNTADQVFRLRKTKFLVSHNNRKLNSGRGFRLQNIHVYSKKTRKLIWIKPIYHEN